MDIESKIQQGMFSQNSEKTFIDKLLAREDTNAIRELIKKKKLTREDLLEILYLLSGTEAKLLNYGEWDRYVILKFFVWIREFVKIAELLYDYQDKLKASEKKGRLKIVYTSKETKPGIFITTKETKRVTFKISPRTQQLLDNNERLIEHNAKFLIDLYLNIGRSSLSLGATGIMEILKNKYEISYPNAIPGQQAPPQDEGRKMIRVAR